ncbi:hypothetical protein EC988_001464 [Linderina pennispora]|nr:hypothetical protein EC988_001464 [Linderina pennispora]
MPSQAVSETLLRALGDKQQAWEAVLALVRRQISDKHVLVDPIANRVITNCIIAEHTKPEGAVVGDQNPRFGSDVLSALEEEGLLVDAAVAGAFPVRALLESPVTGPKAKELLQGARAQIAQAMDKAEKKRVYEAILALLG